MKIVKWLVLGIFALSLAACTEAKIEKVGSAPSASADLEASASVSADLEANVSVSVNAEASASVSVSTEASASATPTVEEESPSPESAHPEIYNVGDSVKFDDLIITVNGVRQSKSEFFTPGEGNVILLIDVTAENKGDGEKAISSLMQTELVDGDGFNYNLTIVDDAKGSFDGSVGAGRKLRGEIAFEVPKDAALEFIFQDPFRTGQAIWKIK